MGRRSAGTMTTGEAMRLEIGYLLKHGFIRKGFHLSGSISWTSGSNIGYHSKFTEEDQEIRLVYWNQSYSGERTDLDYTIQLTSIPSNLGRGEIWYFVCPFTGRKAKILYKCYGSPYFKCRKAYHNRIYYSGQTSSKLGLSNDKYFELESKLEKLKPLIRKAHYKGKETKLSRRIRNLEAKRDYYDSLRWYSFPKSILRMLKSDFPNH